MLAAAIPMEISDQMTLTPAIIDEACRKIEDNVPFFIRKDGTEIVIDKVMPFLVIYRYQEDKPDKLLVDLVRTQACYAVVSAEEEISRLLECVSHAITSKFKAFLIIEIGPTEEDVIRIGCNDVESTPVIDLFRKSISEFEFGHHHLNLEAETFCDESVTTPLSGKEQRDKAMLWLQLRMPGWFVLENNKLNYPLLYRNFKKHFSRTLKKTAFEFIHIHTADTFSNYLMLGKTRIGETGQTVDSLLAEFSAGLSFLLNVTPVNEEAAWKEFSSSRFIKAPLFSYRLIRKDPDLMKRELFDLRLEDVEDPTMQFLLREKRDELDTMLNMLSTRETPEFAHHSAILYGSPDRALVDTARKILGDLSISPKEKRKTMDSHEFVKQAQPDMNYYRAQFPEMNIRCEIRDDIIGLMVDKEVLLVSDKLCISPFRARALVHHEVGTHILTYCNGHEQVFKQMYAGLAGYEELQEGLAVMAEYLAGGLNHERLRLLAGRVLAVKAMSEGSPFADTFNLLKHEYQFSERTAWKITLRVYRGGGLTKDAIYLKGLFNLIKYLQQGGNLDILYTGKFNLHHVSFIEELMHRGITTKPVLPLFYEIEDFEEKLDEVRSPEFNITQLLN